MRVSRRNLLFVLLFVGGIILPTAILSFLSFRNIQNEVYLAQKNFNESVSSFQSEIEDAVEKEQNKIFIQLKILKNLLVKQKNK